MTFVSYAQNNEDVLLWRALQAVEHGCYIDVGAADPDEDNVTRAFYDAGWRGVNVEPMETFSAQLRVRRPDDVNLSVAVGGELGERVFYEIWAQADETSHQKPTGLSTLDPALASWARDLGWDVRETTVQVTTLAAICRDYTHGAIHLLKVDAEGSEREVLSGADFVTFRPWIVVVEALRPGTLIPNYADWESILSDAGYHFVWFDGLNRFYVVDEHLGDLAQNFLTPVNLFDDFVRFDAEAAARLAEARAAIAAKEAELASLREQLDRTAGERDELLVTKTEHAIEFLHRAADYDQKIGSLYRQLAESENRLDVSLRGAVACEQQLAETRREVFALDQTLSAARADMDALRRGHAATVGQLQGLAFDLRWDQAPRALKAVLPFARLIRRSYGVVRREEPVKASETISSFPTSSSGVSTRASIESRAGLASDERNDYVPRIPVRRWDRRLALLFYRPFRPIIRPVAWRLRTFLTAEVLRELRRLRDAEPHQPSPPPPPPTPPLPSPPPPPPSPAVADLEALAETVDRLLLTLALEQRANTHHDL